MNSRRTEIAACFLACFLLVAGLQHWSGASAAAFDGYPDEPAHYLGGLLVHDYLAAGFPLTPPRPYAVNYYLHLPYFAIGYWPPLFYVAEGLWMEVAGYNRPAVLLFLALIAALIAATIFALVRPSLGTAGAFLCAVLFLLLPSVLEGSFMVMTDTAVALLSFWSVLVLARYFETVGYRDAILFGVLASCTIMTKYSGAFLVLVPPMGLLLGRRWDLLRQPSFWLQPLVVAVLCGPWALYTKQFAAQGFASYRQLAFVAALPRYLHLWTLEFGLWVSILLFGAWICQTLFLSKANALSRLLWSLPLAVLLFQSLAPVAVETRYLTPALAPLVVLLGFGLSRLPKWYGPAVLAVTVAGCAVLWLPRSRQPNAIGPIVDTVIHYNGSAHQSLVYVPADEEGPMIAEFAMRDTRRPERILARTNKVLVQMDWIGNYYKANYEQPGALQQFFVRNAPDLVILHHGFRAANEMPHVKLLEATIHDYPDCWKLLETAGAHEIYRFTCPGDGQGVITPLFRSRMTGRFETQLSAHDSVR